MKTITNQEQAIENIKQFNNEVNSFLDSNTKPGVETLVSNIPHYRAWYFFYEKESGSYLFAPSKYIGYSHIDAQIYTELNRTGLDGRQTESILSTWYETISVSHKDYEQLSDQLRLFCSKFDKKPNSLFRINAEISKSPQTTLEEKVVDFIFDAYQNLSNESQRLIKARIIKHKS